MVRGEPFPPSLVEFPERVALDGQIRLQDIQYLAGGTGVRRYLRDQGFQILQPVLLLLQVLPGLAGFRQSLALAFKLARQAREIPPDLLQVLPDLGRGFGEFVQPGPLHLQLRFDGLAGLDQPIEHVPRPLVPFDGRAQIGQGAGDGSGVSIDLLEPGFERRHPALDGPRLLIGGLKGGQQAVHLSGPGGQLFFQGRDAGNRYDPLLQIRFQLLAQGRALGPHVLDQRREGLPRLLLILSQTAGQRFDLGEFLAQQTDVGLQLDQLRGLRLEIAGESGERLPVGLPVMLEGGNRSGDGA